MFIYIEYGASGENVAAAYNFHFEVLLLDKGCYFQETYEH